MAGSTTDEIWAAARRWRASVLVAYPLTLSDIVNAQGAENGDSPFHIALSGGSPLAPRIKRDYRERLGIHLLESYGQSELGGFMALGSAGDGERALVGYVGRPLPDRLAYVGGPDGREIAAGEIGEVLVTEGYFSGYWNKPHKTSEATVGGVLHTGDLGISDPDGYLKVLGRTRESDGAKLRGGFLREVEDAFYEHPDIQHAAIVDCQRDGDVEAFVELRASRGIDPDKLSEFVAARVPKGLRPRSVTILEQMPRTFSGKANRVKLAAACAR
jgi:acyl-CoA synthetase (AMP-forming)/AMP-acid ligase II